MTSPKELEALLGQEIGVSRWFLVDQQRIDLFAETTEDLQFIHVDPEKAKATPFGGTIAHGFLTLSLLSEMASDAIEPVDGVAHSVNYGFDRIRFVSPVPSGAQIRGRFKLANIVTEGQQLTKTLDVTVEIEGSSKPALVAVWITRHYFA